MNLHSTRIYLLFVIVFLVSCSNKQQEQKLTECTERLERQNGIALTAISVSEDYLNKLVSDDNSAERYEFLKPSVHYFIENSKRFLQVVANAVTSVSTKDSVALFKQYQSLQKSYKILKQKITDSFSTVKLDRNINDFMNLDVKTFYQKYMIAEDSADSKLKLLFLQADAILNEEFFIEVINSSLSPVESCCFEWVSAIGTTDRLIYKRGERLKLTATLTKRYRTRRGYAIINGERVETTNGLIQYSKTINEKPGLRKIQFKIFIEKSGKIEVYPAEVRYKVE